MVGDRYLCYRSPFESTSGSTITVSLARAFVTDKFRKAAGTVCLNSRSQNIESLHMIREGKRWLSTENYDHIYQSQSQLHYLPWILLIVAKLGADSKETQLNLPCRVSDREPTTEDRPQHGSASVFESKQDHADISGRCGSDQPSPQSAV